MDGCFFSFIQVSVRVHSFTNIFGKTGLVLQEPLQWTRGPAHLCLFAGKCFYQIPINFPQLVFFYYHSPVSISTEKRRKNVLYVQLFLCHCEAQQLRFGSLTISFSLISEIRVSFIFRANGGKELKRNLRPSVFLFSCLFPEKMRIPIQPIIILLPLQKKIQKFIRLLINLQK